MKRTIATVVTAAVSITLAAAAFAGPAAAADGYNATIAGHPSGVPLTALAGSSTQTVDVVNLPANVGLYGLHCVVPADPRQAPTLCDSSTGSFAYLTATPADRPTVSFPLRVNAEFWGINPNPTAAPSVGSAVDCRSAQCAVYVMGAGKESANPAWIRFWPTMFNPVNANRKNDAATITYNGTVLTNGRKPVLSMSKPGTITVTTRSGLTPDVVGNTCTVKNGTITALKPNGACVVRITTNGGRNYKPLVQVQVFKLAK